MICTEENVLCILHPFLSWATLAATCRKQVTKSLLMTMNTLSNSVVLWPLSLSLLLRRQSLETVFDASFPCSSLFATYSCIR